MAQHLDTIDLTITVPAELIEIIGSAEEAADKARIALVIELLREV